jgi:hypothetical protein
VQPLRQNIVAVDSEQIEGGKRRLRVVPPGMQLVASGNAIVADPNRMAIDHK